MASFPAVVLPAEHSSEPLRNVRPGVAQRTTCKFSVSFRLDATPTFSTAQRSWTSVSREFGYLLIRVLVGAKHLPVIGWRSPAQDAGRPGKRRRVYRWIHSRLAASLVLPSYQVPEGPAWPESGAQAQPEFQASRQILEVKRKGRGSLRVVCHVFAPAQSHAAENLLEEFVRDFNADDRKVELPDEVSGMLLVGNRSRIRLRRRCLWEIVIAPEGAIASVPRAPDLEGTPLVTTPDGGQASHAAHSVEGVPAIRDSDLVFGSALPDAETFDRVAARTEVDWQFMTDEISRAIKSGVVLDDEFVEALAHRRYEHARVVLADVNPGPTLESSRRIAREVVAIHQLALGGSGPDQSG